MTSKGFVLFITLLWTLCDVALLQRLHQGKPCSSVFSGVNLPCLCHEEANGTFINCDGVSFFGGFPVLPFRQRIVSYSQSGSGLQSLEAQLFTASDIPVQNVDFSHNLLRRIPERMFEGVEDTLQSINLSNNKLGDQLNSVFSTSEFQKLSHVRQLDLSQNEIKEFHSGVFNGLASLEVLNVAKNFIVVIPRSAFQNLQSLKSLHLQGNVILDIGVHSFPNLTQLQFLNLSSNDVMSVQDGAFSVLPKLETLILSNNRLHTLGSSLLYRMNYLTYLDASQNLLESFLLDSNLGLSLKKLVLHSNKIRSMSSVFLDHLTSLEYLDLRRNRIYEIPPNIFVNLKNLKELHLDVNSARKLSKEMFSGLESLSELTLNDNRILAFPSEPLSAFQNLKKLHLDYNRVAAISSQILAPARNSKELSLAFNLISEIPDGTFRGFQNLELLNLHGNKISNFSESKIEGLENSLLYLDIGYNEISEIPFFKFSNLIILSVAKNKITKMSSENLKFLSNVIYFNASYNMIRNLQPYLLMDLKSLQNLDLQSNILTKIPNGLFRNLSILDINLKNNKIQELVESNFDHLPSIKNLDLSFNLIEKLSIASFSNTPNLETLNLMNNKIQTFRGDEISHPRNIHTLNLSHNKITFIHPASFSLYNKLEDLDLSFNELSLLPRETISNLNALSQINLEGNKIKLISYGYFSNFPNLKSIRLQNNEINTIAEYTFQNSTNINKIFLYGNKLSSLNENTFAGISRLHLDISDNELSILPSNIFARGKVLQLETINLAHNEFMEFPHDALKYSFLEKINVSHNKINNLPAQSGVLANVKDLDFSHNPLSLDAQYTLFGEPKSVRKLFVENVGVTNLPKLECPFLRELSLKGNRISKINPTVFDTSNMLKDLDLSYNVIENIDSNLYAMWLRLSNLQSIDLSGNSLKRISKIDFNRLLHLKSLKLCDLKELTEINCDSLHKLPRLQHLKLHGLPLLQNIDIKQCLQNISALETLSIELKDFLLKDQLQAIFSPKLSTVSISGRNVRSVSTSAFAGMLSPVIKIEISDTSIDTFTDKIFLPLPLSSKLEFNIPNNKIQRIAPDMLSIMDNKQVDITMQGVNSNPIRCDCNIKPLWQWLKDKISTVSHRHQGYNLLTNLMCSEPSNLRNRRINNVSETDLICVNTEDSRTSSATTVPTPTLVRGTTPNPEHPMIIFEQPITKKPTVPYIASSGTRSTLTKVDHMIIGIVAGVVAFVCILIVIICIVRLRRAHPLYTAGPLAGPLAFRAQGKCTCLKPPPNNCTCYPMRNMPPPFPSNGRPPLLPNPQHKMLPPPPLPYPGFSTARSGRMRNTPYYVTYPDSENEHK